MKKLIAIALLAFAGAAIAKCPAYAPYNCTPGYNGKMICGCGR